MQVLEARKVAKDFSSDGLTISVVRGVSLSLNRGQSLAITGRSGSGKSTLLHILGGLETPTSGDVFVEGENLSQMDDLQRTMFRRKKIGFIFQAFNLLPNLTAVDNVAMPLLIDGVSRNAALDQAAAMLELLGLGERRAHLPAKLSGGEQQRVAISRALVIKPTIILADEPTGNLDSETGALAMSLLYRRCAEHDAALVVVTHDDQVAAGANRCIRLVDGQIADEFADVG